MGLDILHDAWHGAYSAFMRWRQEIAHAAGFPPLELMEGFYSDNDTRSPWLLLDYKFGKDVLEMAAIKRLRERLPIKWDIFEKHPLYPLLSHSDCDGHIPYGKCGKIADALEELLPSLPEDEAGGHIGSWRAKTEAFIAGCRAAHKDKERLEFR